MKKLKDGFTLIELLVVIGIISILTVFISSKLRDELAKSKDARAIALLGAGRIAGETAFVKEIQFSETGIVALTLEDIQNQLDIKSVDVMGGEGVNNIPVGGSKSSGNGTVKYGGNVFLAFFKSGNLTKIGDTAFEVKDEVVIKLLEDITTTNEYSTEGMKWIDY